ncbi:MAG: class I SAM-dependent methyltransferase [Holophagaceae bacterium]|uniref:Class I SAM-dependent methyltransferase n=1 Tax=Candidatus Geothrix skivensis TaxID=2954439 RepID=A0A9D7XJR5_9BACT|nr:class I SAM-dependent methyltransferase [Candidatus Geothrix skivensis]
MRGEELGLAYATLDSSGYYKEIESENSKKMARSIRDLKTFLHADSTVLDIGTGNGLFVELLHQEGFTDISAHEIPGGDLSKITRIANKIYEDFDYTSIASNSFDAVTLLDVVEHVPDPSYLLSMCNRILKSGGMIYFHTPVVTRIDRLMHVLQKLPVISKIGIMWQRARTSIFHLQNYTPQSLQLLLQNAGFGEIQIEVRNELSWPMALYVRIYLLQKNGLPGWLAPLFVPILRPLLATDTFNANKAIVRAIKQS